MELSMIQKRIEQIENFEKENKIARDAIKNELENNTLYLEAVEEAKVALEKRKRIKDEVIGQQEIQKLTADIKENNEEVAALKEILSAELMQVYSETQADEIQDQFGEIRKFKIIAKLLPKRKNKDDQDRDHEGRYVREQAAQIDPNNILNSKQ